MRFLIAVEGYRESGVYYMDFTEEMTDAHPEIVFKMGELMGEYMKMGGKFIDGNGEVAM